MEDDGASKARNPARERYSIEIVPLAGFANRVLQYLTAIKLSQLLEDCPIYNISLPELGLVVPKSEEADDAGRYFQLEVFEIPDLSVIEKILRRGHQQSLRLANFCQQYRNFPPIELVRGIFNVFSDKYPNVPVFGDDHLLIHVRADDILEGIWHYPLLPFSFYRFLIEKTGKKPVFMGQLKTCLYVTALRAEFPDALFLEAQDLAYDFETIRRASHIVLSASTFCWLAAWTSAATTIHLPIVGFYTHYHLSDIDLIPSDDKRYHFWRFPIYFGMPESEFLLFQSRLENTWALVSRRKIDMMRKQKSLLRPDLASQLSFLEADAARIFFENDRKLRRFTTPYSAFLDHCPIEDHRIMNFDEYFYLNTYTDAAISVADGWYQSGFEHYVDLGHESGYLPVRKDDEIIIQVSKSDFVVTQSRDKQHAETILDLDGSYFEITDFWLFIDSILESPPKYRIAVLSNQGQWTDMREMAEATFSRRWFPRPGISAKAIKVTCISAPLLGLDGVEVRGKMIDER